MFNSIGDKFKHLVLLAATSAPVVAFAQVADPFTEAKDTIVEKIGVYGAALVAVSAVGVVFSLAIKYVKRLPKAG